MKLSGTDKKLWAAADVIQGAFWNSDPLDLWDDETEDYSPTLLNLLEKKYKIPSRLVEDFVEKTVRLFGDDADLDYDVRPFADAWESCGGTWRGAMHYYAEQF